MTFKTMMEPYRAKSVEPLAFTTREEREAELRRSSYNLFQIRADKVLIDLLTDSGTSAMSAEQWAGVMRGDESYAGARSFYRFERAVRDVTGYRSVLPVHQGRAAERILFSLLAGPSPAAPGRAILANSHFDTTRANVEAAGLEAVDFPCKESLDPAAPFPFKGNMDTLALEAEIRRRGRENIPLILMTVTNNTVGGQPASMKNLREVSEIALHYGIALFLDAARFAENAMLIRLREAGWSTRAPADIAREMFSVASGCLVSAKKDPLGNIGGFLAMNDEGLVEGARQSLILGEGFPTYGGLAGRDMEAIAQGLAEAVELPYLEDRIRSVEHLAAGIRRAGVPIIEPPGGHAVFVDAGRFLSHIPPASLPAQALACELYLAGGVRAVEIGSLAFGRRDNGTFTPARQELLRLALPRRVYSRSHLDYVAEVFAEVAGRAKSIRGMRILEAPRAMAHFSAKLMPEPS